MKFAVLILFLYSGFLFAEGATEVPAASPAVQTTNGVRQIDADTYQIGAVRLDRKGRKISIPATINMVEGPVEYLVVSVLGKLHESIFKTVAEPIHIHTAMLLLQKAPASTNQPASVRIQIALGPGKTVRAEEVFENTSAEKSLSVGPWSYNGSRLVEGTFIAQRDGSIIAIISDPDALVESGRVSAEDDENWRPKKSALPPVGTPVELIFILNEVPALK